VTGHTRGIGRAVAVAFAEAGADVVGVSQSLEPGGGDVGRDVTGFGRAFRGYGCDLGDRRAVYELLEQVHRDTPRIDVLVNNAGVILRRPAAEHTDDLWDRVIEVDLNAQFVLARELGVRMLERGSGKIIFVASVLAFQGGVNVPGYAASKGGIAQLTKALANEWASRGVNVNAVAPGYFETDATRAVHDDPERFRQIVDRIPAGRWGRPDDLVGAMLFLASAASDYVNGIVLPVDGGWLAR
jgi:2-dehydro-3-deoxy-D-gluconate 5-dehydrogenase